MKKRIKIIHKTKYQYNVPVKFGPHRLMMRPREGHDVHIVNGRLDVEPAATIRWLRDIYSNSIALLTFAEASQNLSILGEVEVDLDDDNPIECLIDPDARLFPFQYAPEEQIELIHYRLPSYPYEGPRLRQWLSDMYRPGQTVGTFELLEKLNAQIYRTFAYKHRDDPGVQLPCDTLAKGSGSCRDFAVFMMEAARHWGFGARFVSGYIQMAEGQHGATHAWTEIYIPGAGWRGFDPTNNKLAGNEHVSVAVALEQEKACPVAGVWEGPANAFSNMEVSVQVVLL
jgi:transglutaminase-like putative cysteine protease